jgi:hypothetical protein
MHRAAAAVTLPPEAWALTSLRDATYHDAFRVAVDDPRAKTAEEWVRLMIGGAPLKSRSQLVPGWTLLGLRLGSPFSQSRVLGWEVRRSTPDAVVLGARSRVGMPAELLLVRERESLLFATVVQHRNAVVRALWKAVVPVHVEIVPRLLTRAGRPP